MDIPSYLMGAIKGAHDAGIKYVVVETLPTTGEEGIIYLVPKSTSKTNNIYDEYMYISNNWELIGDTEADLSNYLAKNNTIAFTPSGDYNPSTKKYVDDKVSDATIQYSTMPTASSSNVGQIIQYTGTTTNDYTNGYFYECIEDNNVYSWENINVQDAGGSASDLYVIKGRISYSNNTLYLNDYNTADNIAIYTMLYNKMATDGLDAIDTSKIKFYDSWNKQYYSVSEFSYWEGLDRINVVFKISWTSYSTEYGVSYQWYNDLYIYGVRTNGEVTSLGYQPYKYNTLRYADQLIAKDNTQAFTPTGNYNPATKKYVDDTVSSAIGTALQGNY